MAAPATAPALVYDRIASNRRATCLLILVSAALLLPVALPVSEYLALWWLMLLGPQLVSNMVTAIAVGAAALVAVLLFEYIYAAELVLFSTKARPLAACEHEELRRVVENLSIGCGMTSPKIYLIDTPALNAFSLGLTPKQARLVFTSGMVSRLDYRGMEAVAAHELAHIHNHDTRLGTLLAAIVATFWLPARIMRGVFGLLYRLHPALWVVALLWWGFQLSLGINLGIRLLSDVLVYGEWVRLMAMAALGYVIFASPFIAVLLRRLLWQQREELAEAEAVLLTRYPPALKNALAEIDFNCALPANPATAHLFIADPLRGSSRLFDRLFSAHPRMSDRIELISRQGPGADQQEAAARIARIMPPVSAAEILLAVELWPRKVYAALLLLLGPVMLMLVRGRGFVWWLYNSYGWFVLLAAMVAISLVMPYEEYSISCEDRETRSGINLLALWRAWQASRAWLDRLLEGPLCADRLSEHELRLVHEWLEQIREFLVSHVAPGEQQLALIDERLRYLEESSRTQDRTVWARTAVSAVFTIASALALSPEQRYKLFALTSELQQQDRLRL